MNRLHVAAIVAGVVVLALAGVAAADVDGDGIRSASEVADGTDPFDADTDDDGLDDGAESGHGTDPTTADTDGDGLEDGAEVEAGADPQEPDTDADGLDDAAEVNDHGTNPNATDTDADGLDDAVELDYGANPTTADTDGDGLEDGAEVEAGADPTTADTDADGLGDAAEVNDHGTDPDAVDTDDDGLDDPTEVDGVTDPTAADTDDDGLDDGREREAGTDPTDPDTDGDRLTDGVEVLGAGPYGTQLPGADPLRMDLYAEIHHAEHAGAPASFVLESAREHFEDMPVENPDGSTGIQFHALEGGELDVPTYNGGNYNDVVEPLEGAIGAGDAAPHGALFVRFAPGAENAGLAPAPGRTAIVAAEYRAGRQDNILVHELLHNVMGTLDDTGGCSDSVHYCGGGFLHPTDGNGAYLPDVLAEEIESEGFEGPTVG